VLVIAVGSIITVEKLAVVPVPPMAVKVKKPTEIEPVNPLVELPTSFARLDAKMGFAVDPPDPPPHSDVELHG